MKLGRRKPAELALRRLGDDADGDSRLTDAARKLYRKIIASYNWENGYAECSDNFVTHKMDTSLRSVKRGRKLLLETARVSIVRKGGRRGTERWSTRYDLPFGYRGSDEFRLLNGGRHTLDWLATPVTLPFDRPLRRKSQSAKNALPKVPNFPISQSATVAPKPISKEIDIPPPPGSAGPDGPRVGGREVDTVTRASAGPPPGYAVWRITHAGYVGVKGQCEDDYDTLLAHLRSQRGGKFTLRCHLDSDEYDSLESAMGIDGEPERLVGREVAMSTKREGPKTFCRPRPEPWREFTVVSGESLDDGGAALQAVFHDEGRQEPQRWVLGARDAAALAEACGGEDGAVGARVRFRLMPDDSLEFRLLVAGRAEAA
ncbi:hypothetical protein [Bradyrhizobium sp. CCBAU 45384]|uniref:hypothetical protein n=1 Tax=Bradyrhizobium sp. CCBAU 45384 TaxID=858428 RepID=UPI002306D24D|nr:hypothetical protein [Bradyrhizobium sp. CCBAU 45384]